MGTDGAILTCPVCQREMKGELKARSGTWRFDCYGTPENRHKVNIYIQAESFHPVKSEDDIPSASSLLERARKVSRGK